MVFDCVIQRLKILEVYNMKEVKLKYCGKYFNSEQVSPTIDQIDHSFGATHPGIYDSTHHLFTLNFRGLSFSFPIQSHFEPHYVQGLGSIKFPNGSSPSVNRMRIYSGNSASDTVPPPLPFNCFLGLTYTEEARVLVDGDSITGISLVLIKELSSPLLRTKDKLQSVRRDVKFGDHCQDIVSALGAPQRIFYKSEDKMRIHVPSSRRNSCKKSPSDFIYNYFALGIDVLFDGVSLEAVKFILHTNFPGHYNFDIYYRCLFSVACGGSDGVVNVTALSRWDEVQRLGLTTSNRPVVLNRASSTNTSNPFGSTFCYGFKQMIFEVMPNNHIASLTIYKSRNET